MLKHIKRQNIIIFFGCKIGAGVLADTRMVKEISQIFQTRYDKEKFILPIPDVFEDLESSDANFEMIVSNTLQ